VVNLLRKRLETKRKKKKSYRLLLLLLTVTLIPLILAGVFYGAYYYIMNQSLNSYEKALVQIVSDIGQSNKRLGDFIKEDSINKELIELIKKELPQDLSKLSETRDKLKALIPSDKYKKSQIHLEEGLHNNILLYRQIHTIALNPASKEIDAISAELKKYNDEMTMGYLGYQSKSFEELWPKQAQDFIRKFSEYSNMLVKERTEVEARALQITEYTDNMKLVIDKFLPIKTDFGASLQKERTGTRNFNTVLSELDAARNKFKELKGDFAAVTPPKDAQAVHSSFNRVLSDYELFLQELRFAVNNEKAKTSDSALEEAELKSIYASSKSKFAEMSKRFDDFLRSYSALK
jgi:uncharacterized protein YukE